MERGETTTGVDPEGTMKCRGSVGNRVVISQLVLPLRSMDRVIFRLVLSPPPPPPPPPPPLLHPLPSSHSRCLSKASSRRVSSRQAIYLISSRTRHSARLERSMARAVQASEDRHDSFRIRRKRVRLLWDYSTNAAATTRRNCVSSILR